MQRIKNVKSDMDYKKDSQSENYNLHKIPRAYSNLCSVQTSIQYPFLSIDPSVLKQKKMNKKLKVSVSGEKIDFG